MSSEKIRNEVSVTNKYYISKHRHLELKHFCLQYPDWKEKHAKWSTGNIPSQFSLRRGSGYSDPTAVFAALCAEYSRKIALVEQCCKDADPDIWNYILIGVTQDKPYTWLHMNMDIPCGKDMYYDRYRKFFFLLSQARS